MWAHACSRGGAVTLLMSSNALQNKHLFWFSVSVCVFVLFVLSLSW